jgi:hypothetical protein
MWLRQQPVMAPILDNPEFPDFFMDFKHSLLHPEEAGEDNSQAQSVGAGS